MAKQGGLTDKSGCIKLAQDMNTQLNAIAKDLQKLHDDLDALMKGDGTDAYWNGTDALAFYKKAVGNLKNDLADYTTAYNRANALAVKAESK